MGFGISQSGPSGGPGPQQGGLELEYRVEFPDFDDYEWAEIEAKGGSRESG